jgi:hypothetical protein
MARKHPFGPAAAKVEKQAVTAEKIKARLKVALQRFQPKPKKVTGK